MRNMCLQDNLIYSYMAKKITQEQQVIDALREQGGYATLGELYHLVDTRLWATNSIRMMIFPNNMKQCV